MEHETKAGPRSYRNSRQTSYRRAPTRGHQLADAVIDEMLPRAQTHSEPECQGGGESNT